MELVGWTWLWLLCVPAVGGRVIAALFYVSVRME